MVLPEPFVLTQFKWLAHALAPSQLVTSLMSQGGRLFERWRSFHTREGERERKERGKNKKLSNQKREAPTLLFERFWRWHAPQSGNVCVMVITWKIYRHQRMTAQDTR